MHKQEFHWITLLLLPRVDKIGGDLVPVGTFDFDDSCMIVLIDNSALSWGWSHNLLWILNVEICDIEYIMRYSMEVNIAAIMQSPLIAFYFPNKLKIYHQCQLIWMFYD